MGNSSFDGGLYASSWWNYFLPDGAFILFVERALKQQFFVSQPLFFLHCPYIYRYFHFLEKGLLISWARKRISFEVFFTKPQIWAPVVLLLNSEWKRDDFDSCKIWKHVQGKMIKMISYTTKKLTKISTKMFSQKCSNLTCVWNFQNQIVLSFFVSNQKIVFFFSYKITFVPLKTKNAKNMVLSWPVGGGMDHISPSPKTEISDYASIVVKTPIVNYYVFSVLHLL